MLGWRRAYGDLNPHALLAFSSEASTLTVAGAPVDRDALIAEAGLDWQITTAMTLGVAYAGQVGPRGQEHSVRGNFILHFGTY